MKHELIETINKVNSERLHFIYFDEKIEAYWSTKKK